VDVLLHRNRHFDILDDTGFDPRGRLSEPPTFRRVPKRLTPGMFELEPPVTTGPLPRAVIVYDDSGPFAVFGVPAIPHSCDHFNYLPMEYPGYLPTIDPIIVRKSLFRFPPGPFHRDNDLFWTLRRPNPADRRGNFLRYLVDFEAGISIGEGVSKLREDINKLYGELLAHADRECLRIARQWPQQYQGAVMTACAEGTERTRQLFEAFPLLAWYLYIRRDVFPCERPDLELAPGTTLIGTHLKEIVEGGAPLKEICRLAGVPYRLRKVDPHTASESMYLDVHEVRFQIRSYWAIENDLGVFNKICKAMDRMSIPKDRATRRIWVLLMETGIKDQQKINWIFEHVDGTRIERFRRTTLDWMRSATGEERWRPGISWKEAIRLSRIWHRHVAEQLNRAAEVRRKLDAEADAKPFPDAWFEPWKHGDWCIEYIPDRGRLAEHGREQRNCVASYSRQIVLGRKQIYQALYKGNTKLTIEVRADLEAMCFVLGPVLGKANTIPKPEAVAMVKNWCKVALSAHVKSHQYEEAMA